MCLAIYKPQGLLVPDEYLEEGFDCNPHGAGFAVVRNGRLATFKGFDKYEDFAKAYKPFADDQCLIHFRWATHGSRNAKNTHPFRVTGETAMIHNGVLDISTASKPKRSDTWHFVEHVLAPLAKRDRDFFLRSEMIYLGSQAISGSKFAFLRADGEYAIWNEDDGHWKDGVWYSNYSYRPRVGYTTTYSYGGGCSWQDRFEKKSTSTGLIIPGKDDDDDSDGPIVIGGGTGDPTIAQREFDEWMERVRDEAHSESRYIGTLPNDIMFEYEDLVEHGYTVAELDEMIQDRGPEAISELYNYHIDGGEGS